MLWEIKIMLILFKHHLHFFKRNPEFYFKDIVTGNNIVVSSAESRRFLKDMGIDGEIHSIFQKALHSASISMTNSLCHFLPKNFYSKQEPSLLATIQLFTESEYVLYTYL